MFQSYLSQLFKKETGWRYARTAAMGNTGEKKGLFFAIGEGSRFFVACFLPTQQHPNVFVSDAWPAPATLSPVVLWTLWPEVGSEPLTGAPHSDFMAQSLVLSLDVCPGRGISPLRTNVWLSFSQADLGPRSAQELFFSGFLRSLKLFFRRFALIASGTKIFWRVYLKI